LKEKRTGRPSTKPGELREGFYIELRNKGSNTAIKICRDTKEEMEQSLIQYSKTKIASYLGQVKNGKWVDGKNKGKKTA